MSTCVGCGLQVNPVSGVLEVELDPAGGITCGDDGLAVTSVPAAGVALSDDACQAIELRADGLYANCAMSICNTAQHNSAQNALLPITITGATDDVYDFEGDLVTINNDTCREVAGIITVQVGGLYVDTGAGGFFGTASLEVNINGAGYASATPDTGKRVHGASLFGDFNNLHESNYLSIAAGGSATYRARLHLVAWNGDANLHGAVNIQLVWALSPVGACT